jgi:hypothetical protein
MAFREEVPKWERLRHIANALGGTLIGVPNALKKFIIEPPFSTAFTFFRGLVAESD